MKIVVSYSGGKDSEACLIWAIRKYGAGNVTALFCDTAYRVHNSEQPRLYAGKYSQVRNKA